MTRNPIRQTTSGRTGAVALLASIALVTTAACGQATPTSPSGSAFSADGTEAKKGGLSMDVSQWTFQFSPGPNPVLSPSGSGWQFTLPHEDGVHYLTTNQRPSPSANTISASIEIDTTGAPFFEYRTDPDNTCDTPATVRLFLQRSGDDLSGDGKFAYYRWWSNPVAYTLAAGATTLTGDLSDPTQWTSVFGARASDGLEKEFHAALVHIGSLGFTFGGGCFFGHGVYVTPGTGEATFKLTRFAVE